MPDCWCEACSRRERLRAGHRSVKIYAQQPRGAQPQSEYRERVQISGVPLLRESIAGRNVTGIETTAEPLRTFGGGSVSERFRTHVPSGHLLNSIVPYCSDSIQTGIDIGLVDKISLFREMAPDTGQEPSVLLMILKRATSPLTAPGPNLAY